jgi:hypothetical protein
MVAAALMVALVIIFNEYVWTIINKRKRWGSIIISITICVVCCMPTYLFSHHIIVQQLKKQGNTPIFYGNITVGNEPTPIPLPSNVSKDTITIMLGDTMRVLLNEHQSYVIAEQNTPIVSIGFDSNGVMLINADVCDSNNNRIVYIKNSVFQANALYAFYPTQPDSHSLIVNDFSGNQVLNIDYMNPKVIRLYGNFYIPGISYPFNIQPNSEIRFGGLTIEPNSSTWNLTQSDTNGFINIGSNGSVSIGGN